MKDAKAKFVNEKEDTRGNYFKAIFTNIER